MNRFPFLDHCTLAEVAERERLIADLKRRHLSLPETKRLRELCARAHGQYTATPTPDAAA